MKLSAFGAVTSLSQSLQVTAVSCWRNTTCSGPRVAAFPGPWNSNIYAPSSRTVQPKSIFTTKNRSLTPYAGPGMLRGNGSNIVYDIGREVGGIVSISYSATGSVSIGLAFTEASTWIGEWSDASNGKFAGRDGALYVGVTSSGNGTYTMPDKVMRGGFRYMTAFLISTRTLGLPLLKSGKRPSVEIWGREGAAGNIALEGDCAIMSVDGGKYDMLVIN